MLINRSAKRYALPCCGLVLRNRSLRALCILLFRNVNTLPTICFHLFVYLLKPGSPFGDLGVFLSLVFLVGYGRVLANCPLLTLEHRSHFGSRYSFRLVRIARLFWPIPQESELALGHLWPKKACDSHQPERVP